MPDNTTSHADLPVSRRARDLYQEVKDLEPYPRRGVPCGPMLDVLAHSDPDAVRDLLYAWREGKL